jgi:hypothetical protein
MNMSPADEIESRKETFYFQRENTSVASHAESFHS